MSQKGEIQARYPLKARNIDWEALTGDQDFLYIGDIGNNHGDRKEVKILRIDRQLLGVEIKTPVKRLRIRYADYPREKLTKYEHDYDAEALVARENDLLLFSKSWKSDITRVYSISKTQREQTVSPIASFDSSGWVVTGADFDRRDGSVVLVGYLSGKMPAMSAVIAHLDANLKLQALLPLPGSQVEAICMLQNGEIFYTQETSFWSSAQLKRIAYPFEP